MESSTKVSCFHDRDCRFSLWVYSDGGGAEEWRSLQWHWPISVKELFFNWELTSRNLALVNLVFTSLCCALTIRGPERWERRRRGEKDDGQKKTTEYFLLEIKTNGVCFHACQSTVNVAGCSSVSHESTAPSSGRRPHVSPLKTCWVSFWLFTLCLYEAVCVCWVKVSVFMLESWIH